MGRIHQRQRRHVRKYVSYIDSCSRSSSEGCCSSSSCSSSCSCSCSCSCSSSCSEECCYNKKGCCYDGKGDCRNYGPCGAPYGGGSCAPCFPPYYTQLNGPIVPRQRLYRPGQGVGVYGARLPLY